MIPARKRARWTGRAQTLGAMAARRRRNGAVALVAASVTFVSTLLLAVLAWTGHESVAWLFVLSAVNSSANSS